MARANRLEEGGDAALGSGLAEGERAVGDERERSSGLSTEGALKLIVDTGPLVALLDRRDRLHSWALETFERLSPPFLTCEAVLTEASHFLDDSSALRAAWLAGELAVDFDCEKHRERVCALMRRYAPMDFADACLVAMAEIHHPATVVTIDRKDFSRYRTHGRNRLRTVMPGQ